MTYGQLWLEYFNAFLISENHRDKDEKFLSFFGPVGPKIAQNDSEWHKTQKKAKKKF